VWKRWLPLVQRLGGNTGRDQKLEKMDEKSLR